MLDPNSSMKLAEQAIKNARLALENGNELEAKNLAEQAVQLSPEMEDPWLILAYLVEPSEGLKYLEKVLMQNPNSIRAQKGIHYLIKKIQDQNQTIPFGYEKFSKEEKQNLDILDKAAIPSESSAVEPAVIYEKNWVKVESLSDDHFKENTEIITSNLNESVPRPQNKPVYEPPLFSSQKQPSKSRRIDFVNVFISLFGLLILTITILIILYANHLLPFS